MGRALQIKSKDGNLEVVTNSDNLTIEKCYIFKDTPEFTVRLVSDYYSTRMEISEETYNKIMYILQPEDVSTTPKTTEEKQHE